MGHYSYYKNNRSRGPKATYFCIRNGTLGRASTVVLENIVLTIKNYHNHRPLFTTTRYGKPAILLGRFRFTKNNRSKGPKALWTCSRVSAGCRATISTIDDVIYKQKNEHNH
ncbi:uncharacterized protein LOC133516692 [Cydia pomonella]|uniref:uncharacterized protein LOC133516692 n=1 Tax=Cydia pomonella TaxID=82600 RepID=UPI002ADE31FF|nr:uncharacterized protein LOC133516692 [Cydia pomonella]